MLKLCLVPIVWVFASSASGAGNCDAIQSEIDAKIRASGVARFTLATVDADAAVSGKVVGTCDLGTKKIVYESAPPETAGAASGPRSSPNGPRNEAILTECRDGSVSVGGDCRK